MDAPVHRSPIVAKTPKVPLFDNVSETILVRYSSETGNIPITESTTVFCSDMVGKKYPIIEITAKAKGNRENRVQYAIPAAIYGELFLIKSVNETNINHTNTQILCLVTKRVCLNNLNLLGLKKGRLYIEKFM